jgi:putative flippase GtrA
MKIPTPYFIFESVFFPRRYDSLESQVIRQALSGATATSLDLLSFYIAITLGVHPMVAAVISIVVGLSTNFTITKFYVIGEVKIQKKKTWFQFFIYVLCAMVSLLIVQIFLLIFNVILGFYAFYVKLVTVPVVFIWTVFISRYVVFNKISKKTDIKDDECAKTDDITEDTEKVNGELLDTADVVKRATTSKTV